MARTSQNVYKPQRPKDITLYRIFGLELKDFKSGNNYKLNIKKLQWGYKRLAMYYLDCLNCPENENEREEIMTQIDKVYYDIIGSKRWEPSYRRDARLGLYHGPKLNWDIIQKIIPASEIKTIRLPELPTILPPTPPMSPTEPNDSETEIDEDWIDVEVTEIINDLTSSIIQQPASPIKLYQPTTEPISPMMVKTKAAKKSVMSKRKNLFQHHNTHKRLKNLTSEELIRKRPSAEIINATGNYIIKLKQHRWRKADGLMIEAEYSSGHSKYHQFDEMVCKQPKLLIEMIKNLYKTKPTTSYKTFKNKVSELYPNDLCFFKN